MSIICVCGGSGAISVPVDDGEYIITRCEECCQFATDFDAASDNYKNVRVTASISSRGNVLDLTGHIRDSVNECSGKTLDEKQCSAICKAIEEYLQVTNSKIVRNIDGIDFRNKNAE